MTTKQKIDAGLKKAGITGEIQRGQGYIYFSGDSFDHCNGTSVYGIRFYNELSVEDAVWHAEHLIKHGE